MGSKSTKENKFIRQLKKSPIHLINPERWSNIPVPVVKAFKLLLNHTSLLTEETLESDHQYAQLIDKVHKDTDYLMGKIRQHNVDMYKMLDQADTKAAEQWEALGGSISSQLREYTQESHEMMLDYKRQKEIIDTKLSMVDDTAIVKSWVKSQIELVRKEFREFNEAALQIHGY